MTVIAFRPRTGGPRRGSMSMVVPVTGSFSSPSGRLGRMTGRLRVRRLVVLPRGTFLAGVCTGELRDADGSLVGVDSRRVTVPFELVRLDEGYAAAMDPFPVELLGLTVRVPATTGLETLPVLGRQRRWATPAPR